MRICLLFLAVSLLLAPACNRKTARSTSAKLPAKRNADQLLRSIEESLYVPQVAEMKGDMRVNTASIGNLSFKAIIRTQADSVFWISLRKLGFEGARAMVTRDSFIALNRLQREAMVGSPQQLPEEFGALPFEPSLRNMLAAFGGQPIGDWRGADVERLPGQYSMRLPAEPNARLDVQAGKQPRPVRWTNLEGDRFGEVTFSDFRQTEGGRIFPYRRTFMFSDEPGDTTRVDLELSSLTSHDALEFPISIPSSYELSSF